jgi:hypothetical protein
MDSDWLAYLLVVKRTTSSGSNWLKSGPSETWHGIEAGNYVWHLLILGWIKRGLTKSWRDVEVVATAMASNFGSPEPLALRL